MVTHITETVIITLIIISQILYNFKLFTLIFIFLSLYYYNVGNFFGGHPRLFY